MKRIALFLAACTMVIHVTAQVSFGKPEKINKDWKFILSDSDNYQQVKFDDKKWKTVQIPHDWSVKEQLSTTLASCMGYLPGGVGWYRKSINIPASRQGEKVYLYFEGVYNRSEVYFNGRLLGKRPNGYISFMYDATPYVEYGKENVIAVRVDHSQSPIRVGTQDQVFIVMYGWFMPIRCTLLNGVYLPIRKILPPNKAF